MTSTFQADIISTVKDDGWIPVAFNNLTSESETEDEEVRMNCSGGFRGIDDSDINTTDHSEGGDDVLSEGETVDRYVISANFLCSFFPMSEYLIFRVISLFAESGL